MDGSGRSTHCHCGSYPFTVHIHSCQCLSPGLSGPQLLLWPCAAWRPQWCKNVWNLVSPQGFFYWFYLWNDKLCPKRETQERKFWSSRKFWMFIFHKQWILLGFFLCHSLAVCIRTNHLFMYSLLVLTKLRCVLIHECAKETAACFWLLLLSEDSHVIS